MTRIDENSLHYLAKLSRLELTPSRTERFIHDLESILGHIAELEKIDTKGVLPMTSAAGTVNVLREDDTDFDDVMAAAAEKNLITAAFPESRNGYLKVPKIL